MVACRDTARFLRRVRKDTGQPLTRVYVGMETFQARTGEDPGPSKQWLLLDSDQVDTDATRALAARLIAAGPLIIAARFPHLVPMARATVPAKLDALQCNGAVLRLFYYADDQMDLLASFFSVVPTIKLRAPKATTSKIYPTRSILCWGQLKR